MKPAVVTVTFIAALSVVLPATAQQAPTASHDHHHAAAAQEISAEAEGTVRAVDAAKAMVTLAHGPIAAFNWPPMTMDLKLERPELAEGVAVGSKVRFTLKKVGPTDYVISAIRPAR